ncbi:MAG: cupin domain-containing protein [Acidobacteria bacterium]|nr:cupin domain-containing protein [Acidobacteriota bacterium]
MITVKSYCCMVAILGCSLTVSRLQGQTSPQDTRLQSRIVHSDPSKYRSVSNAHGGAGTLSLSELLGQEKFNVNLAFLHRGVLQPKSGVGHHFHNQMEEMFVIFDNKAQFTIDGRTAELTGPAGAPCRMGSSHGIYNPTDAPTQFMNIAVNLVRRGPYDSFELGDDRVGVLLDAKPIFMNMKLDKSLLKPVPALHGGKGTVQYRRALGPEVFRTNWGYVDHLAIPPSASVGYHRHDLQEEIYYVISGKGRVVVNGETSLIAAGDAVPVRLREAHAFENSASDDFELMVIGIALEKGKFDSTDVPLGVAMP